MSDLKDQLIKIGETNPDLREHLRPILDKVASRQVEAATTKSNLMGVPSFMKVEGLDSLAKSMQGLCSISALEWYVSPGMSYVDVDVTWDMSGRDQGDLKSELEGRIRMTAWGKHLTRMGVSVHPKGGSFTLNL